MQQVHSVRGVGCKRGYPYFATGLYRQHRCASGKLVWRLVRSGRWHRSTNPKVCGELESGVPFVSGIRHNSLCSA